jgi:hypothetical protein
MTLAISLRQIASVLEAVERAQCNDIEVLPREGKIVDEQQVSTDVDVRIPIADLTTDDAQAASVDVTDAELTDTGFEFRMSIQATGDNGDHQDATATTSEANGEHADIQSGSDTVESANSAPMDGSPVASRTASSTETTETDGGAVQEQTVDVADQPPYRDPDALRRVYDEYSTFAEMTDALDADVTPQTVRRHMIKHGIHDPSSMANRTNGDLSADEQGQAEVPESNGQRETDGATTDRDTSLTGKRGSATSQDVSVDDGDGSADPKGAPVNGDIDAAELAEGIDLPEEMTIGELKTAVKTSKTLFEIHRELGIDQDHAREVLRELNLLELVHGRVSTIAEAETTEDEIEERIRAAVVGSSE